MLGFANTGWEVITAFVAFAIGVFFSYNQRKIFDLPSKLSVALYVWHTAMCLYYFYYSLNNDADATNYYLMSLSSFQKFEVGTRGVDFIISIFSSGLGMSYGGTFLVFNLFGAVGLLALASTLLEFLPERHLVVRRLAVATLFLPGISFWSAGIGKDSLTAR